MTSQKSKIKLREYIQYNVKIRRNYTEETEGGTTSNKTNFWVVTISDALSKVSRRCDSKTEIMSFLKEELHLA